MSEFSANEKELLDYLRTLPVDRVRALRDKLAVILNRAEMRGARGEGDERREEASRHNSEFKTRRKAGKLERNKIVSLY